MPGTKSRKTRRHGMMGRTAIQAAGQSGERSDTSTESRIDTDKRKIRRKRETEERARRETKRNAGEKKRNAVEKKKGW